MVTKADYEDDVRVKKKEKWWRKFLKWIEKGAKKDPPHCGKCK